MYDHIKYRLLNNAITLRYTLDTKFYDMWFSKTVWRAFAGSHCWRKLFLTTHRVYYMKTYVPTTQNLLVALNYHYVICRCAKGAISSHLHSGIRVSLTINDCVANHVLLLCQFVGFVRGKSARTLQPITTSRLIQYATIRLNLWFRWVSNLRELVSEPIYRFEIWQAIRQPESDWRREGVFVLRLSTWSRMYNA